MRLRALLLVVLLLLAKPIGALADATSEGQEAARQGTSDGRSDGAREGRERGAVDGFADGRRQGFDDAAERLGKELGEREGQQKGEREGFDRGSHEGREKGERDGAREGEADGRTRAEQESAGPGQSQGTTEAERSQARVLGTRDGTAGGEQDALSQAKKVDQARGHEQYRTERWHLPPRSRQRYTVPRVGADMPLQAALAANDLTDLVAWGDDPKVPSPDRRYWRSSPPYPDAHRAHWYASTYGGAYHDGFRDAYRSEYASARVRGREAGRSDARGRDLKGSSVWRRAFDDALSAAYRRVFDQVFPRAFEDARRGAYAETFGRLSRETREREYPPAFERHRQSAYEARYNALYGETFKAAHDARFAALYAGLAKQWYAKGRADEMASFQARPIRIAYVAVRDDGDGVVAPGETVHLDVVLRNFSNAAVRPGKLGLAIDSKPADTLAAAERRPGLPCGLAPGEELEIVDLIRLQASPNAVGRTCVLDARLRLNGQEVDALTQEITVQWPVTAKLEGAASMVEGLPATWSLVLENKSKKPIPSMQVKLSTDSGQLSLPSTVLSVEVLAPGASATLPIEVMGWRTRETTPPQVTVEVTGDGRVLNRTALPLTADVHSPFTVDYVGGKMRLRDSGDWKVDFRLTGPGDQGPVQADAIVDPTCKTHIDIIGVDNGPDGRVAVRVRVYEPNTGGRFLLRVKQGDKVIMSRRVEF